MGNGAVHGSASIKKRGANRKLLENHAPSISSSAHRRRREGSLGGARPRHSPSLACRGVPPYTLNPCRNPCLHEDSLIQYSQRQLPVQGALLRAKRKWQATGDCLLR